MKPSSKPSGLVTYEQSRKNTQTAQSEYVSQNIENIDNQISEEYSEDIVDANDSEEEGIRNVVQETQNPQRLTTMHGAEKEWI